MPETSALLTAALHAASWLASLIGMAWLALAMDVHWQQVRPADAHTPAIARRLRACAIAALAASLALSLTADHPSMAALVWPLTLATSALAVAQTLSWRPHWLRPLSRLA